MFLCTVHCACTGLYFSGDGAFRDDDGHYQITGRVDDVINVKGHRIGTAELESCLVRLRTEDLPLFLAPLPLPPHPPSHTHAYSINLSCDVCKRE